ncbi:MAG TPA: carboxypeptidase-like regulatory domain-containing protein [Candidatus Acidoferrales bacterium]|nr:carboxypeptidase-like regulatory domain-containing protein [Candidatus Acidoferrales bacterium]
MRITSVVRNLALAFVFAFTFACVVSAQQNPTGILKGTVTDASGAVITGASVTVANAATGTNINSVSGNDGRFVVPNLPTGAYNVTVTKEGFKTGVFAAVNIVVNQTYTLLAKLEVGATTVTVEVQAGAEVVQTASTSIGTTVTGPEITSLPFTSRNATDLAVLDPGAQTDGRPRNTSFEGLPKGAINITEDGINTQDNLLKSSDGFFTIIAPRVDDISQMSITTAANSAADSGEGAVQINLVSQGGTNQFHGGAWEYSRQTGYNANYYFNNLSGLPRQVIKSNQFGFKIGGPILKNKLFFYGDLDMYRFPHSLTSFPTVLNAQAATGVMSYNPVDASGNACTPGAAGCVGTGSVNGWTTCTAATSTCTANLLTMASSTGFASRSTADSFTAPILAAMSSAITAPGVGDLGPASPYQENLSFLASGVDNRYFPDVRFDYDLTKTQSLEFDYHYDHYNSNPDFLNGFEETLPVAPFNKNEGGQISNRNLFVGAWRWTIGSNKTNELRFGIQSAPVSFFPNLNIGFYPTASLGALGSVHIQPQFGGGAGIMTEPFLSFATQGRNTALGQLIENFGWTKGAHSMSFGMTATDLRFNDFFAGGEVGGVPLGIASTDPIAAIFTNGNTGNLPGMNPSDLPAAQQIYADVAGTVNSYSGSVFLNTKSRQFQAGLPQLDKYTELEMGFYGTDSWQIRPGLTLNYGLRWEYSGIPHDQLNEYFNVVGGYAAAFGVSGKGNLFKPGTLTGSVPQFVLNGSKPWYNKYYKAFAPSIGLAWQPRLGNSLLQKAFGSSGQTVFRAGYDVSYTREGLFNFQSLAPANPGFSGFQFMNPVASGGGAGTGQFNAGTVQISSLSFPDVAQSPTSFTTQFGLDPAANFGVGMNVYDPNLHSPQVQSWSAGIQRQIGKDMALEVRYVGNHGVGLLDQVDLNEVNIFENGFLTEFNNAQSNLNVCLANATCSTNPSFANTGLAGQVNVPVFTAAFTGSTTGSQTDPNFTSGQFLTPISEGQAGSVANILGGDSNTNGNSTLTFICNLAGSNAFPAGECSAPAPAVGAFSKNYFVVNPDATGGSFLLYNGAQSTYNGLQTVFRRRLSAGLQFEASYTWSKSLTNFYASSASGFHQWRTLRNPSLDKGPAPFDIRNAFKMESLWELPFGPGHRLTTGNGFINRLIGGWAFNTINRWQTGRPTILTGGLGGTFNSNDGGVNIVGMSLSQIQSQLQVIKGNGKVFWFPANLLDSSQRRANSAIFQSCTAPGTFCGRPFIYGPQFFRADWSLVKDTKITERVTFELRADALNAFNDANFYFGGSASANSVTRSIRSTSFGRITSAYQDISTTDDPGGRLLQLVGKISF